MFLLGPHFKTATMYVQKTVTAKQIEDLVKDLIKRTADGYVAQLGHCDPKILGIRIQTAEKIFEELNTEMQKLFLS